jgi:drug/metabolite transporter (DMT)-like permease
MFKKMLRMGPVLIVVAAALWAVDGIIRRSLFALPPITIVFFEHLIGFIIFLPWLIKALKGKQLDKRDWLIAVVVSLLSGLFGTLWFTTALAKVNFISFSVVFLLQKLQPLFAMSTAHLLLKERITRVYAMWAAVALVAAYFVTFPNGVINLATGAGTIVAALFAVGAAAAWGTGTTLSKMLLKNNSEQLATGLRFGLTTIFAFVGVMLVGQSDSLTAVTASQALRFIFIALSTGLVALFIYYRGLKTTEAKVATILELTFPLLAVFIDMILYRSLLLPSQYLAALVLLGAIYKIGSLPKQELSVKKE